MAGIFVYHPRTPSPLPSQTPSANFSSQPHRAPYPHTASAKIMAEYRNNEFWPHPRAAVEAGAFSYGRFPSHAGQGIVALDEHYVLMLTNYLPLPGPDETMPQSISYNPEVVSDSTSSPKEWNEWEKNKNWPFPAHLPAHEVKILREIAEKQRGRPAQHDPSTSHSKRPARSAAAQANANWPLPANALGFQAQNPVPVPSTVVQPAPRTAAQRSQPPPSQQPNIVQSYGNGYSTEPEGRSRNYTHPRRTQPQEPTTTPHAPPSNMLGRLKSALSGKRKADPASPTDPQASNQESSFRRASKKQNTLQAAQGRSEEGTLTSPLCQFLRLTHMNQHERGLI